MWPSSTRRSSVGSSPDSGPRSPGTRPSPDRQGPALLDIHAAFQAENSAQHSLATDKNKKGD